MAIVRLSSHKYRDPPGPVFTFFPAATDQKMGLCRLSVLVTGVFSVFPVRSETEPVFYACVAHQEIWATGRRAQK